MFVFAHLHKCAGTSVVKAAESAGVLLPPGHVNGHPPGEGGHALAGLSRMSPVRVDGVLRPLARSGVQLVALEWDFPAFNKFPTDLDLQFFTIFRDPVERVLSNYAFDVTMTPSRARNLREWMEHPVIWTQPNYYCRFFSGLVFRQAVKPSHVDKVAETLAAHFKVAFFGDDLLHFLAHDVGLPISSLPKANKVSAWRKVLNRSRLRISPGERAQLREMNALDYQLYNTLLHRRKAPIPSPKPAGG
jgi:hypothetical protein